MNTVEPVPSRSDPTGATVDRYALWGKVGVFGGLGVGAIGGLFSVLAKQSADDYRKGLSATSMQDSRTRMDL